MFVMSMASLLPSQPQPQTLPVCVCGACVICDTHEWNKIGPRRVAHVRHADAEGAVGCLSFQSGLLALGGLGGAGSLQKRESGGRLCRLARCELSFPFQELEVSGREERRPTT